MPASGPKRRLSLSNWILIALGTGIGVGIFFGERTAILQPFADAFIRLLQMAVLPYIITSLIAGLGSLTRREAGFVARQGGMVLLLLWGVGLGIVLCFPLAFPSWQTASFFSTTLIEPPRSFDFVEMFIPANLFRSAADNVVPAVVLFSIAVGVGLMTVPRREVLIENLDVLSEALTQITDFAVRLSPIGVFAIAASAAGTLGVSELGRLQVYLWTFMALSVLVTLWILPGLVAVLTPLSYRDVVRASRDALLTAFSTGSLLVVLPLLAERAKELLAQLEAEGEDTDNVVDVLVPVSFNFPTVGKLLTLSFVLFAGWFAGTEVRWSDYPVFLISGVFTFFGSLNVALPFMLDLLRIPADMFQLFLAVSFINYRFGTLMSAMHTLVLSLLATCAVSGLVTVRWPQLLRYLGVSLFSVLLVVGSVRVLFEVVIGSSYRGYEQVTERALTAPFPPALVHEDRPPDRGTARGSSRLDLIRESRILRVAYRPNALPMTYVNSQGDLVGLDIELAHELARELDVALEFVRLDFARLPEQLASGEIDMMLGLVVTPDRAQVMAFSNTYLDATLAFLVEDHQRQEFGSRDSVQALDHPVVAVPPSEYYRRVLRAYLPQAEIVMLDSPSEFFEAEPGRFDAMLYVAEMGAAWTLIYPEFAVAIPQPDVRKAPIAVALPRGDPDLLAFVNSWVEVQTTGGRVDRLYQHWVLGRELGEREPRWSVIRDVLHWVD